MSVTHQTAQEIFESHPTRFTKKEKAALRSTLREKFIRLGYSEEEITEIDASGTNLLVGNPRAEYMFTAHYDTPGRTGWMLKTASLWGQTGANIFLILVMLLLGGAVPFACAYLFPEVTPDSIVWIGEGALLILLGVMLLCMIVKNKNNRNDNTSGVLSLLAMAEKVAADEDMRKKCCFVFFDNEEWGLLGSGGFAKHCRKQGIDLSKTKVVNFDCVGYGDILTFASTKKTEIIGSLAAAFEEKGQKPVKKRSAMIFLSDHANFKNSVMVCYTKKSLMGLLYLPLIHTGKDTVCDIDQINRLTDDVFVFAKTGRI
jgi:Predicted aminopeptidases